MNIWAIANLRDVFFVPGESDLISFDIQFQTGSRFNRVLIDINDSA